MTLEKLRSICMALPDVTEDQPFGPDTLAFRQNGKIFALTNLAWVPPAVNLKCDPEISTEYRDRFRGVQPGYHMNKKHWNTVTLEADVPDSEIRALILHSFELVETRSGKEKRIRHDR